MPVREIALQIDQGASFSAGPFCWIGGGQGVNLAGTTPTATFRQRAQDPPLVALTNVPSANGAIIYETPIPNVPLFVASIQATIVVTLYPILVQLTAAAVALLLYPSARWKLNITWPDGTSIDLVHGDVEVASV